MVYLCQEKWSLFHFRWKSKPWFTFRHPEIVNHGSPFSKHPVDIPGSLSLEEDNHSSFEKSYQWFTFFKKWTMVRKIHWPPCIGFTRFSLLAFADKMFLIIFIISFNYIVALILVLQCPLCFFPFITISCVFVLLFFANGWVSKVLGKCSPWKNRYWLQTSCLSP